MIMSYRISAVASRTFLLAITGAAVVGGLSVALGNGGGYHHGITFSGSVAPFEPRGTEQVQIVDENLEIELGAHDAKVTVRYRLKNLADRRSKVRFGFPVETVNNSLFVDPEDKIPFSSEVAQYCQDYKVVFAGEAVKSRLVEEPFAKGKVKAFPGSEVLNGIQGWMVSDISFAANEEVEMTISYRSTYDSKGVSVSDDVKSDGLVFRYRFSTGGVWAGPIGRGTVRIRCHAEVDPDFVQVKGPVNRFKKAGGDWVWEFRDLEPTLADDLTVLAVPARSSFSDHRSYADGEPTAQFVRTGDLWQRQHQDFSVTATSTLPADGDLSYGVDKLVGIDFGEEFGTWSEGADGHGIGESLSLKVEKALQLDAIYIQPGFGISEDLFKANSRPARLEVVLNGEHRFPITLEDENRQQTILVRGYDKPVKEIQLIIAEVYPGSRFEDTCISNLSLLSRLASEPKRYGAR